MQSTSILEPTAKYFFAWLAKKNKCDSQNIFSKNYDLS